MSKWLAKRSTGARVIERPGNRTERWLLDTVAHQARRAGIGMPEVAVYEAPEINACRDRDEPQQRACRGEQRGCSRTCPRTRPRRCSGTR